MNYKIQFTSPTETSVVESAIKLARKRTGRNEVIAFTNAFHGMSLGSLSLTANRSHRHSFMPGGLTRLPYEGYMADQLKTVDLLEKILRDKSSDLDLPAAIILETVQGEGGVNIAIIEWLMSLQEVARCYSIRIIVDDV